MGAGVVALLLGCTHRLAPRPAPAPCEDPAPLLAKAEALVCTQQYEEAWQLLDQAVAQCPSVASIAVEGPNTPSQLSAEWLRHDRRSVRKLAELDLDLARLREEVGRSGCLSPVVSDEIDRIAAWLAATRLPQPGAAPSIPGAHDPGACYDALNDAGSIEGFLVEVVQPDVAAELQRGCVP